MAMRAGGRPDERQDDLDAYYEMGDLGFLSDESDEEATPPVGTHFFDLHQMGDGHDGILLDGRAALYGNGDLHPTTNRSSTFAASLSGLTYEWDLDDVTGERWAGRQDPWDGP